MPTAGILCGRLFHVSTVCLMCLLLADCAHCLFSAYYLSNVSTGCLMCLLLAYSAGCLLNVPGACPMCVPLACCADCLFKSAEASGLLACRGCHQPSKPPKPQTSPQGGGFTLPLPPPTGRGRSVVRSVGGGQAPLDPFKNALKTNTFLIFSLFGPTKPAYIPITLAISCFSTSNCLR